MQTGARLHACGCKVKVSQELTFWELRGYVYAHSGLGRQRVTRLATSHASLASSVRWRSPVPEFHGQLLTAGFDMKAMLHMLDAGLKKQSQSPVEYPMTAPVAVGGRRGGRAKTTCLRSGTADGEGLWGSAGRGGSTMVNPPFVYALEVTSDGRTLALGCGDGTLRTLGLNLDGSVEHLSTRCLQRHKRCVTCVAFPKISPQHRCLTGSDDRRVLLWNLAEPQVSLYNLMHPFTCAKHCHRLAHPEDCSQRPR